MKIYRSRKAAQMILSTYDELLKRWDTEVEEMDLASAFGYTHVIAAGDPEGEPMVMFHGVGDDSALMWLYNAKALAEKYRLYAVDTIGGPGKSVPGGGYAKGFDDAEWIDSILDALKIESTNIVGTSHGAYLAQYYGAMRRSRVKKIACLAGTLPIGTGNPMGTMLRIFMPEALFPTRKNTERLIRKLMGENHSVFLENDLATTHYRWLLKGFNTGAMRHHEIKPLRDDQVDALRPKTIYLAGNDDPFQRLGGKELLERYKMQCQFFDRVGHGINHEIAEEVNRILLEVM